MKTLVAYFSLDGDTQLIAETIADKLKADILNLEPVKPFPSEGFGKFFVGGMSVLFNKKPRLKNEDIDLRQYDNIIIGSPVWAGSYSPPVNTFISKYRFTGKNVALFLCSGGGGVEKCFEKFRKELSGNNFLGEIDFIEPLKTDKTEACKTAVKWAESLSV